MHPLQNKVLRVAAVSGKREVVLKGVVLDVKDGVICLSIKNEEDLIIKERSSGTSAAPGKWDGPNKRAFFRLPTAVSAMVGPRQPTIACQVVNVSGSGICFRTSVQFQLNEVVKLRVSLTDEDTFLLTCQVVRSCLYRGYQVEYGCKFCGLTPTEESNLIGTIFKLQRKKD